MQDAAPRRLIWIPIIHTQEDLGSLGETIRRLHTRQRGRADWQRHQRTIEALWVNIGQEIEQLDLDYAHLRLYQDSLPCCGREEEIVRDLGEIGSRNHQLLLKLMARGARLVGTESPELLLEEYELSRQTVLAASSRSTRTPVQQKASDHILEKRDCYIAQRITQTLLPGETGLVFLGLLHSLDDRLPRHIELTKLDLTPRMIRGNTGRD
jgi:hypothetical protein